MTFDESVNKLHGVPASPKAFFPGTRATKKLKYYGAARTIAKYSTRQSKHTYLSFFYGDENEWLENQDYSRYGGVHTRLGVASVTERGKRTT